MKAEELSDEQLLRLVGSTDKELFDAGLDISSRVFEVPRRVMAKLGYDGFVVPDYRDPGMGGRVDAAFKSIYRKHDIAVGGHIGIFMYRDIYARISVPHGYGKVMIRPFEFVDLTPVQLRIIQTEPDQIAAFLDQFIDVADIQYGIPELKKEFGAIELVERYIDRARLHLHGAAAVLTGGYDPRGAVQSALLATELSLKSACATGGMTGEEMRDKFGHKRGTLAAAVGTLWPSFDVDRVRRVIAAQPEFVANRYNPGQPDRRTIGHVVMGAQFVVAEVVRQLADVNWRRFFTTHTSRHYPA